VQRRKSVATGVNFPVLAADEDGFVSFSPPPEERGTIEDGDTITGATGRSSFVFGIRGEHGINNPIVNKSDRDETRVSARGNDVGGSGQKERADQQAGPLLHPSASSYKDAARVCPIPFTATEISTCFCIIIARKRRSYKPNL